MLGALISAFSREHNERLPMDHVFYKFATKPFLIVAIIIVPAVFFMQSSRKYNAKSKKIYRVFFYTGPPLKS